jgi:phage terminase small subunit
MAPKLTKKQKVFVAEYLETGNGTKAALEAYDIGTKHGTDDPEKVAAVMATQNLAKLNVVEAIRNGSKDEMLEKAHNSLLDAVRLDYFLFPGTMDDKEIDNHLTAQGLTVINIRPTMKGKMAFFSLPDGASRSKGLELAYKIKGSFAAEKHINVNVEVEANPEIKELTQKLNDVYRGTSGSGNGGTTSPVGTEASD